MKKKCTAKKLLLKIGLGQADVSSLAIQMVPLTLVVAATRTNGIGQGALLPWRLPLELAYFARITKNAPPGQINHVIMGRKTWESIPKKRRPLVDRINIIVTHNTEYDLCVLL